MAAKKRNVDSSKYVAAAQRRYADEMLAKMPPIQIPSVSAASSRPQPISSLQFDPTDLVAQFGADLRNSSSDYNPGAGDSYNKDLEPTTKVGKLIDILSQPAYAVTQTALETVKDLGGADNPLEAAKAFAKMPGRTLGNFGANNAKVTAADLGTGNVRFRNEDGSVRSKDFDTALDADENDNGLQKVGKGAALFGAAVLGDPVTYIPGAAIATVGKSGAAGLKGAVAASQASKVAPIAAAGRAAGAAGDLAARGAASVAAPLGRAAEGLAAGTARLEKTALGKPIVGAGRGIAKAVGGVLAPADAIIDASRAKAARALPAEVTFGQHLAQRLGIADEAGIVAGRFDEAYDAISKGERTVKEEVSNLAKVATDAEKVSEGNFVPRVENTVKVRTEPEMEEVKYLVKDGQKRPRKVDYDETLAKTLRKTKEGQPYYPEMQDKIPAEASPFLAPRVTTAAQATEDLATPPAGVVDDIPTPEPELASVDELKAVAKEQGSEPLSVTIAGSSVDIPIDIAIEYFRGTDERAGAITRAIAAGIARKTKKRVERADISAALRKSEGRIRELNDLAKPANQINLNETMKNRGKTAISDALAEKLTKTSAREALRENQPTVVFHRLKGAALASRKAKLIEKWGLSPEDAAYVIGEGVKKDTPAQFAKRFERIKNQKTDGQLLYKTVTEMVEKPKVAEPGAAGEAILDDVVPASEQLKAGVAGGKTAEEIAAPVELSSETHNALAHALGNSQFGKQLDPNAATDYKFKTDTTEALRTSENPQEGFAVHRNALNVKFQANVWRHFQKNYLKEAGKGLRGIERAQFQKKMFYQMFDEVDAYVSRLGGTMITGSATSSRIPLSLADVFKAMDLGEGGSNFVSGRFFDLHGFNISRGSGAEGSWQGSMSAEAFSNAASAIVDYYTKAVPELADAANMGKRFGKKIAAGTTEEFRENFMKLMDREKMFTTRAVPGQARREIVELEKIPGGAAYRRATQEQMFNIMNDPRVVRALVQSAHNNAAKAGIVFGQTVNKLTDSTVSQIFEGVSNPAASARSITETLSEEARNHYFKNAVKAEKASGTFVDVRHEAASADQVEKAVTEIATLDETESIQRLVAVAKAVEDGSPEDIVASLYAQYVQAVGEGASKIELAKLMEYGDNTAAAMNSGISKILEPVAKASLPVRAGNKVGRNFFNHYENATIHPAMLREGNLGRLYQQKVRQNLAEIERAFPGDQGKAVMNAAVKAMQDGIPFDSLEPTVRQAAEALSETMASSFRISPEGALQREAKRRAAGKTTPGEDIFSEHIAKGFGVDHINMRMAAARLPEDMRFDMAKAQAAAKENGTSVISEISQQWKSWKVEDPIDFLAKMSASMGTLATDAGISMEGFRLAKNLGYASDTRRAGFVKYPREEGSILGQFLPKDAWFDPEIVKEFRRMDEIISDKAGVSAFVDNVIGPITTKWKAGVTIYWLGHHTRNFIGDATMTFLAEGLAKGKAAQYYNRSFRMLGKNNIRGQYDDFDMLAVLRGQTVQAEGGKFAARVKIGRNVEELTDMQVQRYAMEHGILPDFATQEDIAPRMAGAKYEGFGQALDNIKPVGGRARQFAGGVSQARDDVIRLSHFMQVLENHPKHLKSLDEIVEYAAARVRRFHPDGSDLTRMERGLRNLFPFYSWMRKAIPLVLEATLMHPGRVMAYPKAMYAAALANGVDPESMSNPFNENGLYPSYLRESTTGPTYINEDGEPVALSFGAPQDDIYSDFLENPAMGVAGMLSPLVKMPIELATGSRIGGARISDKTEYAESSIPFVSKVSSATGYSPLKSIGGILSGEGPQQQTTVAKGNKDALGTGKGPLRMDEDSATSLLGVRSTNWDNPSYRRSAEIEKRDAAKKAREEAMRRLGG